MARERSGERSGAEWDKFKGDDRIVVADFEVPRDHFANPLPEIAADHDRGSGSDYSHIACSV